MHGPSLNGVEWLRLVGRWPLLVVFALLLGGTSAALAATDPVSLMELCATQPDHVYCKDQEKAGLDAETLEFSAGKSLSKMFAALQETFRPKISSGIGVSIVTAFMALGIVLGAIQIIGGMDFVEAVVRYCKLGALAMLALACFQAVPWLGGESLGQFIRGQFIDGGAALFAESKDPPVYLSFQFMKVFDQALSVNVIPKDITSWYGKLGFILENPISTAMALLMVGLSAVVLALSGALVVAEVFLAAISMDLALALTPVLAPWIMWRPTSFLFDAWLKTLLGSGMAFLVASLIGKGALAFAAQAGTIADTLQAGKTYTMASVAAAYGGFLLLSLVFLFLAVRVTRLATSMVSGGVLGGFSMNEFRQGVGGLNALGSRGGSAARGAAAAGGGAVGGAAGAVKGRAAGTGAWSGMRAGAAAGAARASAVVKALQPGARK